MKRIYVSFFLILLFVACKKNDEQIFIEGKWKMDKNYTYFKDQLEETSYAKNIELEINRTNLIFSGESGKERFKITSAQLTNANRIVLDKSSYPIKKDTLNRVYQFVLKDKIGKSFYFEYYFNAGDNQRMYGEFWEVNQVYNSVDMPNSGETIYYTKFDNGKSGYITVFAESLGGYKRIN